MLTEVKVEELIKSEKNLADKTGKNKTVDQQMC
jgi:hypothetical protein